MEAEQLAPVASEGQIIINASPSLDPTVIRPQSRVLLINAPTLAPKTSNPQLQPATHSSRVFPTPPALPFPD
ncbi:Hypothetical protein NTJ_02195 [Nesidiocoris tenuis]|uniref:Uncharacterized protein n=1 Tax=Nesidiocoris tenuis TaxID=355587 RepID=A0ABN7ABJ0_9HEMI|nr:Hypothetical protein NTJ_02195 [Nesidiocoris tenuis]